MPKKVLSIPTAIVTCLQLFISSCATLSNSPAQKIWIATDSTITHLSVEKSILIDSSIQGSRKPASYIVPRSARELAIHFRLDTIEKTLLLHPRNSFAYWYNILGNYAIGMLVDRDKDKRYAYPAWTYLTKNDTGVHRHRFPSIPKGQLRLSLGYAPINILSLKSPEGQYAAFGVFGLETGLDYFYKKDRYLSLTVGAATSAAPVDHFGKGYLRRANTFYANIRNNYVIGSFDLGYGISMADLQWVRTTLGDTVNLNKTTNNIGFGLSLSGQYRIGNSFRIGLLCQPNLLNTDHSPTFNYQHYISLNFCWKIPFNRRR